MDPRELNADQLEAFIDDGNLLWLARSCWCAPEGKIVSNRRVQARQDHMKIFMVLNYCSGQAHRCQLKMIFKITKHQPVETIGPPSRFPTNPAPNPNPISSPSPSPSPSSRQWPPPSPTTGELPTPRLVGDLPASAFYATLLSLHPRSNPAAQDETLARCHGHTSSSPSLPSPRTWRPSRQDEPEPYHRPWRPWKAPWERRHVLLLKTLNQKGSNKLLRPISSSQISSDLVQENDPAH